MDIIKLRKIPLKKVLHSIHLDFKKSAPSQSKVNSYYVEDNLSEVQSVTDKEEVVSVEKLHTTVKEDMTKQFSVQLPFVELEQVMDAITKDQDCMIVVSVGVSWCYPSRKTLENLTQIAGQGVKVFLLNGDRREVVAKFCNAQEDISALPYTFLYWKGRAAKIVHGDKQDYKLVGPLKTSVVTTFADVIRDSAFEVGDPKEDLVIKLP